MVDTYATPNESLPAAAGAFSDWCPLPFKGERCPIPHPSLVHGLIERQAQLRPDAVALICGELQLTFGEMNKRANGLARYLISWGIRNGDIVAVSLDKSSDLVCAILAIFKTGAAYLPLDPEYPEARLSSIVRDSTPRVVLSSTGATHASDLGAPVIFLDDVAPAIVDMMAGPQALPCCAHPEGLAWIYYTSGSAGVAKAVMGTHHATVARCVAMWGMQPVGPDEIYAKQLAITSIDSVWELWAPLARGLTVLLLSTADSASPQRFCELLANAKATQTCLVPTYLKILLENCPNIGLVAPRLRTWISTGEPLTSALIRKFYALLPHAKLLNQYGLTETVATATWMDTSLDPSWQTEGEPVPIGGSIVNASTYVIGTMEIERLGVVGEICVGGVCLALGYFRNPRLTAERFLPDPFGDAGARLYRTGDLGYHQNGVIYYRSRRDRQVKILGHRVDLTEVEAALARIPGVQEAAVIRSGDHSLSAYFTSDKSDRAFVEKIHNHLDNFLPGFMVPTTICRLDRLPKTSTGKVDYMRLAEIPKTVCSDTATASESVEAIRSSLADIWRSVLGVRSVNPEDNFFDLGGNSVSAIRVLSRIHESTGAKVDIEDFFSAATIQDLSAIICQISRRPISLSK